MANLRAWHSSRDAYHCSFRLVRLSEASKGKDIEVERLRVMDMMLLFPSLLHRISMPRPLLNTFKELGIPKAEDIFINLPGIPSVFQELRLYQNSALGQLRAKGMISTSVENGIIQIDRKNVPEDLYKRAAVRNQTDGGLTTFLTGPFAAIPLRGTDNLYKRVGLPKRSILP
ncbi:MULTISPECIES: ABC-three component system middle component 5 [Asticcacaulis]|uniref:ABC-three component system middle component 5 n=1 Tax=Asticcacaulis TaxID=76890 RepID=UPI001AEA54D7|nr:MULTISPECIES: ABC-three component system middle component 5 [Asticcacaulis]MBP2159329.1 hypothetical protein [Asticcacaulis solisilvae]MDR6800374.1 hypothetical protein [Asticcacaulis sp. BE141]